MQPLGELGRRQVAGVLDEEGDEHPGRQAGDAGRLEVGREAPDEAVDRRLLARHVTIVAFTTL